MNPSKSQISLAVVSGIVLVFFLFFFGCQRIDAGHVGLKVNMAGGEKGISKTEYVTGWVFYLKGISRVFEFPTYQQHKQYEPFELLMKGGTVFTVHPSFNYTIHAGNVAAMFQEFRLSVKQLENGYLYNSLLVCLRETSNTFTVDSVLNNLSIYDAAVTERLNKKLAPYFMVSTFTSGMQPSAGLKSTIEQKALALQQAIQLENEQKKIKVKVENDLLEASRDSAVTVKAARAEAMAITVKQQALSQSPQYVDLIKAQRWNGVLPVYMLGGNTPMFLNLNNK